MNATVNAIVVTNTAVYVGGAFTSVGAVTRTRLAAFSPSTGALLGWAPTADSGVNALLVTPDGSRLLAAGSFGTINGATATGLAALNLTTASLLPWAANTVVKNYGTTSAMLSLSTDGSTVYSAGYWARGVGNFEGVLAADANTGAVKWLADCHGDTYDAVPMNGAVYAVSHWHNCENIGAFPDSSPRSVFYRGGAVTSAATGTVARNTQGGYVDFQGQPAPSVLSWFPDLAPGSFTGQTQAAWSTAADRRYLVQGGEFPSVNGVPQQGLVRFAVPSLAPRKQGPRVAGAAFNPILLPMTDRSVRVKWQANVDRDDPTLRYSLTRGTGTSGLTEIYATTLTSQPWLRPAMTFTDTTLTPGQTYRYRITATDPDGNKVSSDIVNLTMPSTVDAYAADVVADGPSSYWRLSGAAPYRDLAGSGDLTTTPGVSPVAAGALNSSSDGAAGFDGATGSASPRSDTARPGPNTFTAEAWFRTTTTTGGKILGYGSSSTGASGTYDRHVYLDNTGRLNFGVHNGTATVLRSPAAYNDGHWHHVVAQLSGAGMALFVDGVQVGSNTVTFGQTYPGYWRIGQDNLNGWPNKPTSQFFSGAVDEVAIYPTVLSLAQLRDHYTRS
ncbi:MAG TPA: LamG-like jellyroll fold domain-containing protein, partial [Actinoplanes sp.]